MANPGYVDSAAAGTGTGASWANANTTLTLAIADQSAGDTIYVSDTHAESTASALTLTFPGTLASPNNVICANDAAEPPTAVATTGTVTTTNNNAINMAGSAVFYGLGFVSGSGATGGANINLAIGDGNAQCYESCAFHVATTSAVARLNFGATSGTGAQEGSVLLKNCTARFGSTSQGVSMFNRRVRWDGGGLDASTSAITNFIATLPSSGVDAVFSGLDLSYGDAGMNLVATAAVAYGKVVFRNCKLPGSWSGALLAGSPSQACFRAEMYNCDDGDTNYRLWVEDYAGSIRSETTIVRTGGASDGTTGLSWKLASTSDAEYPLITLDTPEIVQWNETTGSAITVTVEMVTDNVTLTDAECWLEVQYLGTSGFPLGTFINDAKADFLATAANQTSSSETWTTTGLTTPVKQKLSVTITPQEKGYIHAVVKLAKASTTVYVDPLLTVT